MKKLLYILLFLQIISGVFIFFMLIGSNAFAAVLAGFSSLLQIALTFSVICNTEGVEQLSEETTWLRQKLKRLEEAVNPYNSPKSAVPAAYHGEVARGTWECVKCGTVNKAGQVCKINSSIFKTHPLSLQHRKACGNPSLL